LGAVGGHILACGLTAAPWRVEVISRRQASAIARSLINPVMSDYLFVVASGVSLSLDTIVVNSQEVALLIFATLVWALMYSNGLL
jgi:hypothetical protein